MRRERHQNMSSKNSWTSRVKKNKTSASSKALEKTDFGRRCLHDYQVIDIIVLLILSQQLSCPLFGRKDNICITRARHHTKERSRGISLYSSKNLLKTSSPEKGSITICQSLVSVLLFETSLSHVRCLLLYSPRELYAKHGLCSPVSADHRWILALVLMYSRWTEKRFSEKHEWVTKDGSAATVGISEYAQESLGDVVYVQLPDIGAEFSAHGMLDCSVFLQFHTNRFVLKTQRKSEPSRVLKLRVRYTHHSLARSPKSTLHWKTNLVWSTHLVMTKDGSSRSKSKTKRSTTNSWPKRLMTSFSRLSSSRPTWVGACLFKSGENQ